MSWFVRVDTATGSVKKEPVFEQYRLAGGRSLIARILNEEVDPACEPLGPRNKLIVCPGILGGTSASSSGRISVGGKSPLTGGIKEANAGGTVGHRLSRHGIKAIILENAPEKPACKILVFEDKNDLAWTKNSLTGQKLSLLRWDIMAFPERTRGLPIVFFCGELLLSFSKKPWRMWTGKALRGHVNQADRASWLTFRSI